MKNIALFLIFLSIFHFAFAAEKELQPFSKTFIETWDSEEGLFRMQRSRSKANFWQLLRYYESQMRTTSCSVATAVIALNALGIEAPPSDYLKKYCMFMQEEFFTEKVKAVIDPLDVEIRGMTFKELALALSTFPVEVFAFEAQSLSIDVIREMIVEALNNPGQCVLANYQRTKIGQEGPGHWSPIAAYDAESDSFLLLDVARYKYPPVWIDAAALIQAMQTIDCDHSRGFIILSKIKG
jgi:Phytochelatin synthase